MDFFIQKDYKNHRDTKRIAVASSAGVRVDQHFATAARFWIYDLQENAEWQLHEVRENQTPQCGCGTAGGCGPQTFAFHLDVLHDCDLVVASRIGAAAAASLLDSGIRGHLTTDTVADTLATLKKSPKLSHPLKKRSQP
jgi:predicted Fe-Mo cluster-binding NifX family protein